MKKKLLLTAAFCASLADQTSCEAETWSDGGNPPTNACSWEATKKKVIPPGGTDMDAMCVADACVANGCPYTGFPDGVGCAWNGDCMANSNPATPDKKPRAK